MMLTLGSAQDVVEGRLLVQIGKVFHIDQIVEANAVFEGNKAGGKIVVATSEVGVGEEKGGCGGELTSRCAG